MIPYSSICEPVENGGRLFFLVRGIHVGRDWLLRTRTLQISSVTIRQLLGEFCSMVLSSSRNCRTRNFFTSAAESFLGCKSQHNNNHRPGASLHLQTDCTFVNHPPFWRCGGAGSSDGEVAHVCWAWGCLRFVCGGCHVG